MEDETAPAAGSGGDRLLTTGEAARLIGIKPIALLLLAHAHAVPFTIGRGGLWFRLADLVEIASRRYQQLCDDGGRSAR